MESEASALWKDLDAGVFGDELEKQIASDSSAIENGADERDTEELYSLKGEGIASSMLPPDATLDSPVDQVMVSPSLLHSLTIHLSVAHRFI